MLQADLSNNVEKNMAKAWNFTKYISYHQPFDRSLQKNFPTNILESDTAQMLLIVVLMVDKCLDN